MTIPNHCRDSAGSIVHYVTESTTDASALWNPAIAYKTETIAATTAIGTANELAAYGVSLVQSTLGMAGYYKLAAPVTGYDKSIFCVAGTTTNTVVVYTDSTGTLIQSTGGAAYRTITINSDGGYCYLAAVSTSKWAYLGGYTGAALATT